MHIIIIFNNLPKMWITRYWGKWWSFEAWCIYILHLSHVQFLTVAYEKWSSHNHYTQIPSPWYLYLFVYCKQSCFLYLHSFVLLEIFKYQLLMYFRQIYIYKKYKLLFQKHSRNSANLFITSRFIFSFNLKKQIKNKIMSGAFNAYCKNFIGYDYCLWITSRHINISIISTISSEATG